jgi:hypothetical protein
MPRKPPPLLPPPPPQITLKEIKWRQDSSTSVSKYDVKYK